MSKYLVTITTVLLLGVSPIVYGQYSQPPGPMDTQIKIMQTVDELLTGTQWQVKPLQYDQQQQEEELPPKKQPPKQQQQPKQPPQQQQQPKQPPKQQQQPKQPPKQQQQQHQQPPMQQPHEEQQQMPPKQQQQPKQPPKQEQQQQHQQPPKQQPHEEYQQMPPKQPQQHNEQYQQQYQHEEQQHFENHHDWNRPDYQKLTWHKHHHHYKRYVSPFSWYDPWDFWYDRYHYSDFYFFGAVYDDDWDWLFPGFYTYRWRDYERDDHGFYYRGRRITEVILVFDPYDGLVGIGFMYKGIFIFLRDDAEEYYFDDEPTLVIVARILHW